MRKTQKSAKKVDVCCCNAGSCREGNPKLILRMLRNFANENLGCLGYIGMSGLEDEAHLIRARSLITRVFSRIPDPRSSARHVLQDYYRCNWRYGGNR